MNRHFRSSAVAVTAVVLAGSLAIAAAAQSAAGGSGQLLAAIAEVRAKGCAARQGAAVRLHEVPALDEAARHMAQGTAGDQAAKAAGYRAIRLLSINLSGPPTAASVAAEVAQRYCKQIVDPVMTDFGSHRQ